MHVGWEFPQPPAGSGGIGESSYFTGDRSTGRGGFGIGFDGDGDRLGVVDDKGEIIWGDRLMILYWREILPKYPGTTCIVEVKCSQALVEEIARLGGKPIFFKTGHSLIKAKMREVGAVFTGEMSGHMFFADEYYGFDDAFMPPAGYYVSCPR